MAAVVNHDRSREEIREAVQDTARTEVTRLERNLPILVTIAQVTPFKTILTPGGKLTFPNTDGFPAGVQVTLFRFDQTTISPTLGSFIAAGVATVSADG